MKTTQTTQTTQTQNRVDINRIEFTGMVKRVLVDGEKICVFTLDVAGETPTHKPYHNFITVKTFTEHRPEVGDNINVIAHVSTSSYTKNNEKHYVTEIICDEISEYTPM